MAENVPILDNAERIRDLRIEEEMKESYLTFAMSVIVSRALPDVRDGLKPVQRRILVAMNDLNLGPRAKTRKCAKIVGDAHGNYHPHGNEAIYASLARLAQDFNCRYPLIEGQGNMGSADGDPPAAMRYTEAHFAEPASEIMRDINLDTVDFIPNYDATRQEPTVLPGRFPNLLCNGCSGIAVGMATSIPPHNLREICDAVVRVIDDPEVSVDDLMQIVQGPDFPGGGLICGRSGIREAYRTGRGTLVLRAKTHLETSKSGKRSLVFTEIPYTLNRDGILARIGKCAKDNVIEGISDARNESDKTGCRVVVDLKRDADDKTVLNLLYKHTALQQTFRVMMIALVRSRPQTLNLKQMLVAFKDHRVEVITRRTRFLLARDEDRAHIVEGLLIALRSIDDVIRAIKASANVDAARERLMQEFSLTEVQARAILEMRLQRLTGLEWEKLQQEHDALLERIRNYRAILGDPDLVLDIIREDMHEIKEKHGDERRTEIVAEGVEMEPEDLIAEQTVAVTISHEGYIKRQPITSYRRQHRGGRGITGAGTKEGDFIERLFIASTHDYILFFTDQGRVYWLKVYDVPELGRTSRGRALVNLLRTQRGESVTSTIPVRSFENRYLVMATRRGTVKKTDLEAYSRPRADGIIAIGLSQGDGLVGVRQVTEGEHVVLVTRDGQAIRFQESAVRSMGRPARGVRGIRLRKGDVVVGLVTGSEEDTLLSVCENGYGKRTSFHAYRLTNRGGKGVINIKTTERNGKVVGALSVTDEDDVMMITSGGMIVRTPVKNIRAIGRNTQGVTLISLNKDDRVVSVARVLTSEDENGETAPDPENEPAPDARPDGNSEDGSAQATTGDT